MVIEIGRRSVNSRRLTGQSVAPTIAASVLLRESLEVILFSFSTKSAHRSERGIHYLSRRRTWEGVVVIPVSLTR